MENEQGEEQTYRIVGADEFDPKKNHISLDSPLAQALLKKSVDDEVTIRNTQPPTKYFITAISYSLPSHR